MGDCSSVFSKTRFFKTRFFKDPEAASKEDAGILSKGCSEPGPYPEGKNPSQAQRLQAGRKSHIHKIFDREPSCRSRGVGAEPRCHGATRDEKSRASRRARRARDTASTT